jgi:hypothetical protein
MADLWKLPASDAVVLAARSFKAAADRAGFWAGPVIHNKPDYDMLGGRN